MASGDYTKRSGKFRHCFADTPKGEQCFSEIPKPLTSGEGAYVAASAKYFCFGSASPGKVFVHSLTDPGRWDANQPAISLSCLKGKIWDFSFNPFIDTMLAMGDDSGKIAVANIPTDGLKETLTEATCDLGQVHGKKVLLCEFNPCAASILASASFDRTVKICNIETQSELYKFAGVGDNIYSMQWNQLGSQVAITSKDKKLRIFDPRSMESVVETTSFDGGKSSKVFWIPRLNWIGATGFTKDAKRQLKFWDLADMSKPCYTNKIDNASSVLIPNYDDDNGVLYLAGKGEGRVQFGEIVNDAKKFYPDGGYGVPEPQKGGAWVPKRALDVWKCEVQRFLKLTQKAIRPISFVVPRKAGADVFQEDIYPDCLAPKPAETADEWAGGENRDPVRMKMDPAVRDDSATTTEFVKKKTYAELEAENQALRDEVASLKKQLGITDDDDQKNDDPDTTMASAADNADAAPADDAGDAAADDAGDA